MKQYKECIGFFVVFSGILVKANRKDDNDYGIKQSYCIKDCDFDTARTQCSI